MKACAQRGVIRAAFVGLLGLGTVVFAGARPLPAVAVLPLQNLRPSDDTNWIGHVAAARLASRLDTLPTLLVLEREEVVAALSRRRPAQTESTGSAAVLELGKLLRADFIGLGSYAVQDGGLTLEFRVLDVASGDSVHAASAAGGRTELLDLVCRLAEPTVAALDRRLRAHTALPCAYFAFGRTQSWQGWRETMAKWQETARVATGQTVTEAGGNFECFAQSFVPHCDRIKAVELATWACGTAGWLRVDLCEDDGGRPGSPLARCWLRMEKHWPITGHQPIAYDLPDTDVQSERTYWVTFAEFVDPDTPGRSMTNLGFAPRGTYAEGELVGSSAERPFPMRDAGFRVLSECGSVPCLRKPTARELGTLPGPPCADAHWQKAPAEWYHFQAKRRGGPGGHVTARP